MILDFISQTVIDEVISNSEDEKPNKIREKEESLQNTLVKRFSIPVVSFDEPKKEEQKYEEYYAVPDTKNVYEQYENTDKQIVISHEEKTNFAGENLYDVISIEANELLDGNEKPINVKEHMITNMKKKDINDFSKFIKNESEYSFEEHIVSEMQPSVDIGEFNEEKINTEPSKPKIGEYGIPANIEKVLSNTFDFDTTVVAINKTKKQYQNISEKANIATQAAIESEELLQKVSDEYSEAEKHLKEKEQKSIEMEQKIISILNTEKNRLDQQMQEKETLINDANRRKEQNNDKIVDFRTKINSTIEKANEIDEKISRQEELLNTLVGFNINLDEYNLDDGEKITSRVA